MNLQQQQPINIVPDHYKQYSDDQQSQFEYRPIDPIEQIHYKNVQGENLQKPPLEINKMENQIKNISQKQRVEYTIKYRDPIQSIFVDRAKENRDIFLSYQFPASYKKALVHKNAVKFGYKSATYQENGIKKITQKCYCCGHYKDNEEIPLCYRVQPSSQLQAIEKTNANFQQTSIQKENEKKPDVFKLPSSVSLYFVFIKICIKYLLLRFFVSDIFNIFTNYLGNYCSTNQSNCSDFSSYIAGYNKHTDDDRWSMNLLDLLNIGVTILSIVFFSFCKKHLINISDRCEKNSFSQDEFSLIMSGFPIYLSHDKTKKQVLNFNYEQEIKKQINIIIDKWVKNVYEFKNSHDYSKRNIFKRHFYKRIILQYQKKNIELQTQRVARVTLCYDFQQIKNLNYLRQTLMKQFIQDKQIDLQDGKWQANKQLWSFIPNQINHINELQIQFNQMTKNHSEIIFDISHFIGKAFVTFQYQHYKTYFEHLYEKNPEFFKVSGKTIHIEKPARPKDVNWQNLKYTSLQRTKRIVQSYIAILIFSLFSLAVLVFAQTLQAKGYQLLNQGENSGIFSYSIVKLIFPYLLAAFLPVLTQIMNFGISLAIEKLTAAQNHDTFTHKTSSLIVKNLISGFLNTTIIYYIVAIINSEITPLMPAGYVAKIMSLVYVTSLLQLIMPYIPLSSILECLPCCRDDISIKYGLNKQPQQQQKAFQIQLNKKVQLPSFDYIANYCFYLQMVMIVSFYSAAIPIVSLILIFVFIISYWMDKIQIFWKSSSSRSFNQFLTRLILRALQYSLLVFAIGAFIFAASIRTQLSNFSVFLNSINILIALLYVTLVTLQVQSLLARCFNCLLQFINIKKDVYIYTKSFDYYYERNKFKSTYDSQFPGTSLLTQKRCNESVYKNYPNKFSSYV